MFKPFKGKCEIKPLERDKIILSDDKLYTECGEVIAVGEGVDFVKVGDYIFFDAWKCSKAVEINGTEHYVVSIDEQGTLGKIENE